MNHDIFLKNIVVYEFRFTRFSRLLYFEFFLHIRLFLHIRFYILETLFTGKYFDEFIEVPNFLKTHSYKAFDNFDKVKLLKRNLLLPISVQA